MTRGLYAICDKCNKSIEAIDVHMTSTNRIASLVRDAERGGWTLQLSDEDVSIGCECIHLSGDGQVLREPQSPKSRKLTIRKMLYIMTVAGILLAIFRHPIQLMFDSRVWQAAVAPWSLYGWLFWGGEIVRPPNLKTSPMVAIAFTISTPIAVLTGFFGGWGILKLIADLWKRMSRD